MRLAIRLPIYITGEVNYVVSGMTFGTKFIKEPPEGYIIISIPTTGYALYPRTYKRWYGIPHHMREKKSTQKSSKKY
ncbi:MAG: hypothetical protein QXG34_02280 [Candidatus Bathyarchaeia archaeon]